MPYARSLHQYVLPEFEAEAPDSWVRRLRDISPILPNTSHLAFRKFAPRADWSESPFNLQPDRPLWALYRRTPKHLVHQDIAQAMAKHWSEQPTVGEQAATRALISDYQHFVWHTQGFWAAPFWLLQGEWGGTPMKFTDRERRYMDACGNESIPAPPGAFTPCVFDERVVQQVLARDRLVQAGNRFDVLEKMDRPDHKKAEDDAAELVYREAVLEHLAALAAPAAEYMKSQLGKREISAAVTQGLMRPAPDGLPDTLAVWKEHFLEHGVMVGATMPRQRVFATS